MPAKRNVTNHISLHGHALIFSKLPAEGKPHWRLDLSMTTKTQIKQTSVVI